MAPPRIDGAHTCTRHAPGTPTCYHKCRCRCRQCSLAKQRADTWRELHPQSVDAAGTRRRLQALAASGWPMTWLDARLDYRPGRCHQTTRRAWVTLRVATEIAALYDALWDQPSGAGREDRRARTLAAIKGWPLPLAWDDDDGPHGIDNPAATPAECSPGRQPLIDIIADAAHQGRTAAEVAASTGRRIDSIYTQCRRHGELDLWERLTAGSAA